MSHDLRGEVPDDRRVVSDGAIEVDREWVTEDVVGAMKTALEELVIDKRISKSSS